jgi:hypothetical protein
MKGNAKPKQEIAWPSWTEAKNLSHFFSPIQKGHFIIFYFGPKVIFSEKPVHPTIKTYPKVRRGAA